MKMCHYRAVNVFLVLAICSLVLIILISSTTPPTEKDSLTHHLAIPKLWVTHGGIHEIPWSMASYNPMNVELLYYLILKTGHDTATKYLHSLFCFLTSLLIFIYVRRDLSVGYALLGSLIFISTPIVIKLCTSSYVDLALAFFSTASILAILQWRNTGFQKRWLLLSAIASGLGAGTKYNGFVVVIILFFGVIYIYSKETERLHISLKYATVYFLISAIFFSPWLIKNYILTGNPCFPLFTSLFHGREIEDLFRTVHQPLLARRLLYGESWLQILLIPLRVFFSGQDGSLRYFDGVLNPILLILVPFAFVRQQNSDMKLLFTFSSIYFLLTFFLRDMRVRYIICLLPPLAIMTANGVHNLLEILKNRYFQILRAGAILMIVGLLSFNGAYAYGLFKRLEPISYISGVKSRDQYLSEHLRHYPAVKFINETLPIKARVLFLFAGNRGYYCDREYLYDEFFGGVTVRNILKNSDAVDDIRRGFEGMDVTHVLMDKRLAMGFLANNLEEDRVVLFAHFINDNARLLFSHDGYYIYELV